MMEYKVKTSDGREIAVTPSRDGSYNVDGNKVIPDIRVLGPGMLSIILDHKSYVAEVTKAEFETKTFDIRVNSNTYQLSVSDKFDRLLHDLGMDASASAKAADLKAPMPGLVVDVAVTEGMEVKKGDKLIVLEAMKMENILKAAADGKVKKVSVSKGNTVEKNAILIQFQ